MPERFPVKPTPDTDKSRKKNRKKQKHPCKNKKMVYITCIILLNLQLWKDVKNVTYET